MRFENVSMVLQPAGPFGSSSSLSFLVDLAATQVWFHGCMLAVPSTTPNNPCIDPSFSPSGASALRVTADQLVMEDSSCTAGDAAYLGYSTYCNPPQTWGAGGTAIVANTQSSILTRCSFRDGSGSWWQPGPWFFPLPPTEAGSSTFVGSSGTLMAYDVTQTTGLRGQVAPTPTPRGPSLQIGQVYAPFQISGDNHLGGQLNFQVSGPYGPLAWLILGTKWGSTQTSSGPIAIDFGSIMTVFPVLVPWSTQVSIPVDPTIVGLPIVGQVLFEAPQYIVYYPYFQYYPYYASNASGVWIAN